VLFNYDDLDCHRLEAGCRRWHAISGLLLISLLLCKLVTNDDLQPHIWSGVAASSSSLPWNAAASMANLLLLCCKSVSNGKSVTNAANLLAMLLSASAFAQVRWPSSAAGSQTKWHSIM